MWKLHRPHHVVEEMGVLVTYRNAFLYYAFMPGIWFSAVSYSLIWNMVTPYLFSPITFTIVPGVGKWEDKRIAQAKIYLYAFFLWAIPMLSTIILGLVIT